MDPIFPEGDPSGFERALAQLRAELESDDSRRRDEAAYRSKMLLEFNDFPIEPVNDPNYYPESVGEDLLDRPLTSRETVDLIELLKRLFAESRQRAIGHPNMLLGAIGRATPWTASPALVEILLDHADALTEDELHSIVHRLGRYVSDMQDDSHWPVIVRELVRPRVRGIVARALVDSPAHVNMCMPEDARRLIDLIDDHEKL